MQDNVPFWEIRTRPMISNVIDGPSDAQKGSPREGKDPEDEHAVGGRMTP